MTTDRAREVAQRETVDDCQRPCIDRRDLGVRIVTDRGPDRRRPLGSGEPPVTAYALAPSALRTNPVPRAAAAGAGKNPWPVRSTSRPRSSLPVTLCPTVSMMMTPLSVPMSTAVLSADTETCDPRNASAGSAIVESTAPVSVSRTDSDELPGTVGSPG